MIAVKKPTLLIDKTKVLKNLERMQQKAGAHNLQLRPHFKTHQSKAIGRWYRNMGITKITVSSVEMAQYFASDNWNDITIAFPLNLLEIDEINQLASNIRLQLTIENMESLDFLEKELKHEVGIFIKIDAGYRRTGVDSKNMAELERLTKRIDEITQLHFMGFLAHAGQTYRVHGADKVAEIHHATLHEMAQLKKHFINQYPNLSISIGDTPTCSVMNGFEGVDEMRPGNYVFYDVMQAEIGSCTYDDIAVAVACPVVAKHKESNKIVLYGGGVHFSKDYAEVYGKRVYGLPVKLNENGWGKPIEGAYVKSLSQEHGLLRVSDETYNKIQVGDVLGIIPIHSCLTADNFTHYHSLDGELYDHM